MTQRYYIESDGRVYLVARDGFLDLPSRDEIPFRFDPIAELATPGDVIYCTPILDAHPVDWISKDAVPADPRVTPLVRVAVHATMPRIVSEGVYIKDGLVLLLKGSRGLTKDRWTLPGGFVRFGEGPEEGLAREIQEELGVHANVGDLLAVRSKLGQYTQWHWTQFFYRVDIIGRLRPDPDEIAEARFFKPAEAVSLLSDLLMREVLQTLVSEAG